MDKTPPFYFNLRNSERYTKKFDDAYTVERSLIISSNIKSSSSSSSA